MRERRPTPLLDARRRAVRTSRTMTRVARIASSAFIALLLFITACSDRDDAPVDAGHDLGAVDAAPPDAGSDATLDDAGDVSDAAPNDAGDTLDAATDTDASTPRDAGACDYVAVDEVVVLCSTDYAFVSRFVSEVSGCAPFHGFTPSGPRFADTASAIASDASCDPTCQWRFATSVSRIYCGRRSGYETLTAPDPTCADLYRFAEGYFASVEEHDAAYPCM
jgi:hypothetical protein